MPSARFDTIDSPGRVSGDVFKKLAAANASIRQTTCHLAQWTRSAASSPPDPPDERSKNHGRPNDERRYQHRCRLHTDRAKHEADAQQRSQDSAAADRSTVLRSD
jgi:hypothetical protein